MGKINYKFPYPLINGDCLKEMKKIPDKSINMILADLPYGTTACKWDVIIPFKPLWKQYKRIIKDKGCIALFGVEPFSSYLRMSNIKQYRYDWYWKKHPVLFQHSKNRPMSTIEIISIFSNYSYGHKSLMKNRMNYFPQGVSIGKLTKFHGHQGQFIGLRLNQIGKEYTAQKNVPKNFLEYKRDSSTFHPTQKPVALCEYLIKTYTQEGETVLDNAMGSGTTGVACINTNRKFIGIEKDKEIFKLAKQRLYTHYYRKISRIHYYIINECMKNRISSLFKRTYLDELINKERN